MSKKVYVGMSGGVDSSLTAALLKDQGYNVTGVYMKNWTQDLPGMVCPWKDDYRDAKRVAVSLGIDFKVYDFESQYRAKVVDYMVKEYQAGRTPNPDIMCNQEIKFRLFLDTALEDGADLVATGHYARINDHQLLTGIDTNKDQSYFLYRMPVEALDKTLMPIGELTKAEVRAQAKARNLYTADKPDSQGICFVGKVGIKDFLLAELGPQPEGQVIDQNGEVIGSHDGAIFYTIGQRHGLSLGGGLPYYVTGKNMGNNQVHVTTNLDDDALWKQNLSLSDLHWLGDQPGSSKLQVRTRYRAKLVDCSLKLEGAMAHIELAEAIRAVTPGQSAVIYDNERCLGGGIVV